MIKKVLLLFIIISVLTCSVSALSLSVNNISLEIAQGQSTSETLTLTNDGNKNVTATLLSSVTLTSTTNSSHNLTATIASTQLNVPYQSENSTTITIDVPTDAAKETYQENVTVNYDGESVNFTISVNVVEPSYSIKVDNAYFDDVDQNSTASTTITLKNNGNTVLTNVRLSDNIASKYDVRFNQTTPFNLAISESKGIVVTAFIPRDESLGNHSIGSVDILTNQYNFTSAFSLYANVIGKLIIDDLDVIIDKDIEGNRVSSTNLENGDKISEKARPGSKIEINLKLKNQFDEDSDIEINDIVITVTAKDIDGGEDIEVESNEFDLNADERSDTKTLEFNVPLIIEKETYDIDIHVEGEDENDVIHEVDWTIYLEVDKKSHDVIVYKAEIEPSTIRCNGKANLNIELLNLGKRLEDEVKLEVKNSNLDLNFVEEDIELEKGTEEGNIYEKTIPIEVSKDVKAGSYPITVNVYYDNTILDDYNIVNLNVEECKIAIKEEEKEDKETVIVEKEEPPEEEEGPEITVGEIPEAEISVEKPFTKNLTYIALLLLANTVIVLGVVGLAAKFLLVKF